jgi:hypothetical protein
MSEGRLQAWVHQQVAAGLPAFAGARVTATLPLQVALVNELIAEVLADAARPSSAPSSGAGRPDVAGLVRHVRSVRVDASPGVITLDVALAIDE